MNQYLLSTNPNDKNLQDKNDQKDPTKIKMAVVYAETETKARAFIKGYAGSEVEVYADVWDNLTHSTCLLLKKDVAIPREQLVTLEYWSDSPVLKFENHTLQVS